MWLTPCQFEEISGLGSIRNWKRTIRHENRSLNCYIKLGVIQLHQRYCDCDRCITPILEMGERRSSKRVKNAKRDSEPDGIDGAGLDYNSSASGDDDSVFTLSPDRQKRKRKNVRFSEVSDSGYSALIQDCEVADVKEGARRRTASTSSILTNSSDEGCQWQTDCRHTLTPRYIELDDDYDGAGQFIGDAPTSVKASVQRSAEETSSSRGRSAFCSPNYRGSRGFGPRSRFPGRASEIHKQNDISPKSNGDVTSVQGDKLTVTREITVRDRLTAALTKAGLVGDNPSAWTVEQVVSFVQAAGFPFLSSLFRQQQINGEALMRMQERHLTDYLKVKLGPSLRLFALVRGLQNK
jgi:hypothetical protein